MNLRGVTGYGMFVFPKIARGLGGNFSDSGILLKALSNLKWDRGWNWYSFMA
jgi:hypothetical protein